MRSTTAPILVAFASIMTSVLGLPAQPACQSSSAIGAVYLISNTQSNAIVSLRINKDGTLAAGKTAKTGGSGANSVDGSNNSPAAPDALVSQSALTVAKDFLFAVNAGSNTVSMFKINKNDPTSLMSVGQPVAVPGEFPNTIAASSKQSVVCVGTSGAKAGISCASFTANGLGKMDALRPIALNQTTPPVGPLNTVSQVFFSDDESMLFTTVKGDPTKGNMGFIESFGVGRECGAKQASVSQTGVRSSPNGTAVLFGSSVIPGSTDLFVTDASFGAAVLSIDAATNVATVKGKTALDGQKATCWATVSAATKSAFVTDVGVNRMVEMSLKDASVLSTIDLTANGDPGLIDLKAAGDFIYSLSPGNGTTPAAVTVVGAKSKKQVQHFRVSDGSFDRNAMGMAVFMVKP